MSKINKIFASILAVTLALSFAACEHKPAGGTSSGEETPKEESKVIAYDLQSCHERSEIATLSVNGIDVPIIKFTDFDVAEFEFSGTAEIKITVNENIEYFTVSPLAKNLGGTADGKTLTYTITESQYMIVKINGIKEICIAADDIETDVPVDSGDGIYNIVTDYSADISGAQSVVAALNTAITDAATAGGGIVYVPSGLYKIDGNIILKSNVSLYLAPGAVLRSVEERANYVPTAYKDSLGKDVTWMFYNELGAENIKIYGRGMIDVNGYARLHGKAQLLDTPLYFRQAKNITVNGITVFDGNFWTIEPKLCEECVFTDLKVFNAFTGFTENDAIDICESKNVLVKHMFAVSEDDTYSTKCYASTGRINRPAYDIVEEDVYQSMGITPNLDNVTFDDCLGWTHCGTFKVGDGSIYNQSNVTFKNSYSYKCMQAIKISRPYGNGDYTNIVYDNIDIEGYGGRVSTERRWLYISTYYQSGGTKVSPEDPGNVDGLTIKNINIRELGSTGSCINGAENCYVKNLTFENIRVPYMDEYASTLEEMNAAVNVNKNGTSDYKILPKDNTVREQETEKAANLALAKNGVTVSSSTIKSEDRDPSKAIDGDENTNWCAIDNDGTVYYTLDFGKIISANKVVITWNTSKNCAVAFDILYSTDGTTWKTAKSVKNNPESAITTVDFTPVTARYIKYAHITGGTYAPTFKEIGVYSGETVKKMSVGELDMQIRLTYMNYPESRLAGCTKASVDAFKAARDEAIKVVEGTSNKTVQAAYDELITARKALAELTIPADATNLALKKGVAVSGTQNEGSKATNAVDGYASTCWRSQMTGSTEYWILVDLENEQSIDTITLSWEDCFALVYKISYSTDGVTWHNATVGGESILRNSSKCKQVLSLDEAVNARYVKMTCYEKATGYGVGVYEFGIYKLN